MKSILKCISVLVFWSSLGIIVTQFYGNNDNPLVQTDQLYSLNTNQFNISNPIKQNATQAHIPTHMNTFKMTKCFQSDRGTSIRLYNKLIANKYSQSPTHIKSDYLKIVKYDIEILQRLLTNNILKCAVISNNLRAPLLTTSHCGFHIDYIEVYLTQYKLENGTTYPRTGCTVFSPKCQSYDILFNLNYLYNQYKNSHKYILMLEDDVQFCAHIFEYIYNITIIDEYSRITIDFMPLSVGGTAYLIKTSFIPTFIKQYVNIYHNIQAWNGYPGQLWNDSHNAQQSLDQFIYAYKGFNNIKHDSWNSHMFISDLRFVHHYGRYKSISVLNHTYVPIRCFQYNYMRTERLYAIGYHTMEMSGSLLKRHLHGKWIVPQQIVNDKCQDIETIYTNHSYLTHFQIRNCSKLIQNRLQQ